MLHQILFLSFYLGMVPAMLMSPFAGVLLYCWLDNLPPDQVYAVTLIPEYASFAIGALTFLTWLILEKKTVPRPLPVLLLMIALLLWVNVTSLYALAPGAGSYEWQRTVKVIGFAILTAQMLSTRARLEAFVWVLVLSAVYFAVPGAIKVIISGGSGESAAVKWSSATPTTALFWRPRHVVCSCSPWPCPLRSISGAGRRCCRSAGSAWRGRLCSGSRRPF